MSEFEKWWASDESVLSSQYLTAKAAWDASRREARAEKRREIYISPLYTKILAERADELRRLAEKLPYGRAAGDEPPSHLSWPCDACEREEATKEAVRESLFAHFYDSRDAECYCGWRPNANKGIYLEQWKAHVRALDLSKVGGGK